MGEYTVVMGAVQIKVLKIGERTMFDNAKIKKLEDRIYALEKLIDYGFGLYEYTDPFLHSDNKTRIDVLNELNNICKALGIKRIRTSPSSSKVIYKKIDSNKVVPVISTVTTSNTPYTTWTTSDWQAQFTNSSKPKKRKKK